MYSLQYNTSNLYSRILLDTHALPNYQTSKDALACANQPELVTNNKERPSATQPSSHQSSATEHPQFKHSDCSSMFRWQKKICTKRAQKA